MISRYYYNPLKTAREVTERRLTVEKQPKDHISGQSQTSMTSVKYDYLQVMETITGKFHYNPLRNVGGVSATRTPVNKLAKLTKGYNSG